MGASGRRMVCVRHDKHHVHAHLVGVCRGSRTLCKLLLDLGGGVNGYDVNLCDKCGVCDDVTG